MLDIPPVDPEPWRRRLLNLDIQTALCLMNIPFALCLTPEEYRRAVHSLRLDASLLTVLASLTGDDTFLSWRTGLPPVRVALWHGFIFVNTSKGISKPTDLIGRKVGTKGFFAHLHSMLRDELGAAEVVMRVKSNYSAPADRDIIDEIARWHAVVTGIGD